MNLIPRLSRQNWFKTPREDRSLVGITFVDVLFALVIGQILEVAVGWQKLPATGISHLIVAFTLTVTSWVGYHNSWNRPRYFIRFANFPAAQFGIDVLLVIIYWFAAAYVDMAPGSLGMESSAVPETNLVVISFLLYVAWDQIAYRMRTAEKYPAFLKEFDAPERRKVSGLFLMISAVVMLYISLLNPPRSDSWIVIVDLLLVAILVAYRFAKELAIGPPEPEVQPVKDLREAMRLLARATSEIAGQPESDENPA